MIKDNIITEENCPKTEVLADTSDFAADLLLIMLFWSLCFRVIEMPYAYQCCVYTSCDSYKQANQWDAELSNTHEDLHKRTVAMYPIHADTHCKSAQTCICFEHIMIHTETIKDGNRKQIKA